MRPYTFSEYLQTTFKATLHAPMFYTRHKQSPRNIKKYQEKHIKRLLSHAYETTDFYRQKYDSVGVHPNDFHSLDDLQKFPSVTKDELLDNFPERILSSKINRSKCIESISSGSSGKVITIVHDPKDTWSYALGRFRIFNILSNYYPWDKTLYIYTSEYPGTSYFGLFSSSFISTLSDIDVIVRTIKSNHPTFISSYPSTMMQLMSVIPQKEAQDLNLKLISLGSELSTKDQRKSLENHFGCPVLDEYSSEELGWIAGECLHGSYHLWEDISYIEILSTDSDATLSDRRQGEITGTNLHNYAMPIIRYRQGDLGVLNTIKCSCGRNGRVLTSFIGRHNDTFKFDDGTEKMPSFLLDSLYSLLLNLKMPIADFCLIQKTPNHVLLQIVPQKTITKHDYLKIQKHLQKLIPSKITIEQTTFENLEKTLSGKRNPIISHC